MRAIVDTHEIRIIAVVGMNDGPIFGLREGFPNRKTIGILHGKASSSVCRIRGVNLTNYLMVSYNS